MRTAESRSWSLGLAAGALGLFAASVWVAVQGGLTPLPATDLTTEKLLLQIAGKFVGVFAVFGESAVVLIMLWLGAAGLGAGVRRVLVREARYRGIVQVGLGLAALLLIDWLLAWAGWLGPYTAWLLCGLGGGALAWQVNDVYRAGRWHPDEWIQPPWTLWLALPAGALLLVACACPPGTLWQVEAFGYDVLSYHLQLPREWLSPLLAPGPGMRGLHHNVYSYLPNLVETGYMHVGAMQGSMHQGIYTAQLYHATAAVFAVTALGCLVSRLVGRAAGVLTAALVLAVPWTIITASLAYNEWFALGFAATALLLAFDPVSGTWRGAAAIGLLLGVTTLAKLNIGLMVTPPVLLAMALRLNQGAPWFAAAGWKKAAALAGVAALAGLLTIAPYLVRNAVWTRNPVFPFAAATLGRGHWGEQEVQRWQAAHRPHGSAGERLKLLGERWALNPGFGSVGGVPGTQDESGDRRDVTRFDRGIGVPVLLLAAGVGAGLLLAWPAGRGLAAAMLLMLGWQVVVWLTATHLQSRFLVPTLVPLGVLAGAGLGRLEQVLRGRSPWVTPALAAVAVAGLTATSFGIFFDQTRRAWVPGPEGKPVLLVAAPWQIVDSLAPAELPAGQGYQPGRVGDHPLNHLSRAAPATAPAAATASAAPIATYLVGDAAVLYIRHGRENRFAYHSAFDPDWLGEVIRGVHGHPIAVTAALRRSGFTHVWVHHAELERLHATYGSDPDVTSQTLLGIARRAGWKLAYQDPARVVQLFELP